MSSSQSSRTHFEVELQGYQSNYATELEFRDRMLELLKYDNCFERSLLHAHFTASVWVVNQEISHALLTHHAKLNRWLQLGGHADRDEDLRRVAMKEFQEESGLEKASFLQQGIFDIDIHTIPERKGVPEHEHFDVRFLLVTDGVKSPQKNHESMEIAWIPLEEVGQMTDENGSILRMLNKTQEIKLKMSSRM